MVSKITADVEYAKSIKLPADMFESLENGKRFALDIGGSLAKLAYYSTRQQPCNTVKENESLSGSTELYQVSEESEVRERLHFIKFETKYIELCLDFISRNFIDCENSVDHEKVIKVTGGGAFKYKELISRKLRVQVDKEDEIECLLKGCNFLFRNIADETFSFEKNATPEYRFRTLDMENMFPYLLVQIGSGVSFLKVVSDDEHERIGGSTLGGGTFWGLGSILTKAKGFDELLELARDGDHQKVDMLVKDIYGGSYSALGLPPDLIASSFGKVALSARDDQMSSYSDADMAKSLLLCICNDIGQLACLNARVYNLSKIYFGGYFLRGHATAMNAITFSINFWSKGKLEALFLRHEGYLSAVGAFLKGIEEEDSHRYSFGTLSMTTWGENYAGSSEQASSPSIRCQDIPTRPKDPLCYDVLELDRFAKHLVSCPSLLDVSNYEPDTVNLISDEVARVFWLKCFEDAMDGFCERAVKSQPSRKDAVQRAQRFKQKYLQRLAQLKVNPLCYGSLTVRSLLDTREHCMREFHFVDPYSEQKQKESEVSLLCLKDHLARLDKLSERARLVFLARGLLAGNVFDWGAKHIAVLLEQQEFSFDQALEKIPDRPWLIDDLDEWCDRLMSPHHGPPYKCATFFCDNSGADIILGIFPFARDLLQRGLNIILSANSRPALNDVTYQELNVLAHRVGKICPIICAGLNDGRLIIMESGQESPCLDLRYIDYDLADKMRELQVDLVVLEGMGRAIHTNLGAKFSCDVLKIAVLKNEWLARRMGGEMFSTVFKFEQKTYSCL